jgi:DNA-binding NarL/FixJ family response regulator
MLRRADVCRKWHVSGAAAARAARGRSRRDPHRGPADAAAVCDVVGLVRDGSALLREIASLQPDVVVVDLNMPGLSGLEACRLIRQTAPGTRVVILTASDDSAIRRKAQELGASAFVVKYQVAERLVPAILSTLT